MSDATETFPAEQAVIAAVDQQLAIIHSTVDGLFSSLANAAATLKNVDLSSLPEPIAHELRRRRAYVDIAKTKYMETRAELADQRARYGIEMPTAGATQADA